MLTALISFLGGGAFRYIVGEILAFVNARQQHAQEMDRLRLQGQLDAEAHARRLDMVRLEAEKGVQIINVQREADVARIDAEAFLEGVRAVGKATGIYVVDAWNACIRPGLATVAVGLWIAFEVDAITLSDEGWQLIGAILGLYVVDRQLFKRGR